MLHLKYECKIKTLPKENSNHSRHRDYHNQTQGPAPFFLCPSSDDVNFFWINCSVPCSVCDNHIASNSNMNTFPPFTLTTLVSCLLLLENDRCTKNTLKILDALKDLACTLYKRHRARVVVFTKKVTTVTLF